MNKLAKIVTEMAEYVERSGFSVDYDSSMGQVHIRHMDLEDEGFFLEHDEAAQFTEEAQRMAFEADVDYEVGLLAQAKQYVDCL